MTRLITTGLVFARPRAWDAGLVLLRSLTLLLSGLIAGFFFAFAVDINLALANVSASTYTEVQQLINRSVRNIVFALVYFPVAVIPGLTLLASYREWRTWSFRTALFGYVLYLVGVFLVTQFINIPINTLVASWDRAQPPVVWITIRDQWNTANLVRTIAAIISFVCYTLAFLAPRMSQSQAIVGQESVGRGAGAGDLH